jgi:hypothetical protein
MEYGLFDWWPKQNRPDKEMDELFDPMVHPDDIQLANEINPMGKVFIRTGNEHEYIVIEFGEYKLRVTPESWKPVTGDGFKVGDRVRVLSNGGKNTPKEGIVVSMSWHHKNKSIVYHLSENGKRIKKQYYVSDIEHV